MVKNLPAMQETQIQFLGWEDPMEEKWQPTPVFLPGKSHGQRNLAGYSPRGHKRIRHNLSTKQEQRGQVQSPEMSDFMTLLWLTAIGVF